MMRKITRCACGAALVGVLAMAGCQGSAEQSKIQQDAKDRQILQLTEENHRLEQQLAKERAKNMALASQQPRYEAPRTAPKAAPRGRPANVPSSARSKGVRAVTVGGRTAIRIPGSILFASGQATLSTSARSVVQSIASHLRREYPSGQIEVVGHTDSDPIRRSRNRFRSNQELSEARARAVRDALVAGGIARGRLTVRGRGADSPIASNKTSDGKRQNRRVELVLLAD